MKRRDNGPRAVGRSAIRETIVPLALAAVIGLLHADVVRAEIPVPLELVFAVDTSVSVDGFEYRLQMTGIADAFRDPEIIELIGQQAGVAVALFQWSSSEVDRRYMIPWRLLTDAASVLAFAAEVEGAPRDPVREFTGIGRAIDFGLRLIADNEYAGQQSKIDVSGDGIDNVESLTPTIRRRAGDQGVVINGLAILNDIATLDDYYREYVIHGPGSFVEVAADFDDFARAFLRKLRRELTPAISRDGAAPGRAIRLAGVDGDGGVARRGSLVMRGPAQARELTTQGRSGIPTHLPSREFARGP